jgi:putative heme-binding domain-containing protein
MKQISIWAVLVSAAVSCGAWCWGAEDDGLAPLVEVLRDIEDPAVQLDLLVGMRAGLEGRTSVASPPGWGAVYARLAKSPSSPVRRHAQALAILFDDAEAIAAARALALATSATADDRREAVRILAEKRLKGFAADLCKLVADPAVRGAALRGLAAYDDRAAPLAILAQYARCTPDEKQDALATLASRRDYAAALLAAIEKGTVPREDVTSFTARQLLALKDDGLRERVERLWGTLRETPQDKLTKIARYTKLLTSEYLAQADLDAGQKLYERSCKQCHVLYGEGGKIGPDLTGSNRSNLEYILTNVIDPSAAIPREYRMVVVTTTAGRVLTGMVIERTAQRIVLQTTNERIVLLADDIEELVDSPLSMMPEGQFDQLTSEQVRDLVAYLGRQK